ncbi:MAG: hypothetical protein R3C44_00555 [Chloroflexota bacterium]
MPFNRNVTATPPVAIIIVAWNQLEKTLACLETVAALEYPTTTPFWWTTAVTHPWRYQYLNTSRPLRFYGWRITWGLPVATTRATPGISRGFGAVSAAQQ